MKRATGEGQPPDPLRLGIVGGGRAAWAFGSAWRQAGWPVAGVALRPASASRVPELLGAVRRPVDQLECDVLLLAVSDRAIAEVAESLPPTEAVVFHAGGAIASVRQGFSLHPLKALPPVGSLSDLTGSLLVFEGSHRHLARRIADAMGARFAEITAEQKPLYHAAAVFGSNYVAALLDIAERLIGIDGARADLAALARSAVANWEAHPDEGRFTGPAARGDSEVLESHLLALADSPQLAETYKLLAAEIERAVLASQK